MNIFSYKQDIKKNPFNAIVVGFIFNALGFTISLILDGNDIAIALFCIVGWYYIILGFLRLKRKGLSLQLTGIERFLYVLYILICIIMIIRGYMIDYRYQWISVQGMINFHLFSKNYILPYLMPIVVLIPVKYYNFKLFVKAALIFGVISITMCIINFPKILLESLLLANGYEGKYAFGAGFAGIFIPFAFVLLLKVYINKKQFWITILAMLICIMIYAISARRSGSVVNILLILFSIYYYLKSLRGSKKFIALLVSLFLLIAAFYYLNSSPNFSYIRERGTEDTRSGVDKALLSQMNDFEKIFGKGLNGRYYYPLKDDDYLNGWRYGSETGFYNIVLKGGYLMAYVYILLLLIPALKGIFRSRNILCKAGGFYIVHSLISLYPFGWLEFNINFLVIWMCVALLHSKQVREMNDNEIKAYFFT